MVDYVAADASPEKRLFISLLTRDIPLVAAFLDLVDNSLNAAVEPISQKLKTAADYLGVLQDGEKVERKSVSISFTDREVRVEDNASGISAKTAEEHVFKFGRGADEGHHGDTLSVYGIGLKRALFKLGNKIEIRSDHVEGGFDLDLNVSTWAADRSQPWTFEITKRDPVTSENCGTRITVTELYPDVRDRLIDGLFETQLREAIARTYAFYLAKFVNISVRGIDVDGFGIEIGQNHASEHLNFDGVTCAITAGIGTPQAGSFRDRSSGWFVFCNGRAVISADKSALTGWSTPGALPIFQPKHRPFLGTVFFVSTNPELLPWTTTKAAINEDSSTWQNTKRHMIAAGRSVVTFLDQRYTDEGTEVASKDLQDAAGRSVSVVAASAAQVRSFQPPKRPPKIDTRVQFDALIEDVKRIESYLGRPGMGAASVGRYAFDYFLKNEVDC